MSEVLLDPAEVQVDPLWQKASAEQYVTSVSLQCVKLQPTCVRFSIPPVGLRWAAVGCGGLRRAVQALPVFCCLQGFAVTIMVGIRSLITPLCHHL